MQLRLPILTMAAALALASPAFAQTAPEQAVMDLWCGIAFNSAAATLPAEATEEDKAMAASFIEGGNGLIEKSRVAHVEAGFTEEQFTTSKTELEPVVVEQITTGAGDGADYTFEQCSALIAPAAQ